MTEFTHRRCAHSKLTTPEAGPAAVEAAPTTWGETLLATHSLSSVRLSLCLSARLFVCVSKWESGGLEDQTLLPSLSPAVPFFSLRFSSLPASFSFPRDKTWREWKEELKFTASRFVSSETKDARARSKIPQAGYVSG